MARPTCRAWLTMLFAFSSCSGVPSSAGDAVPSVPAWRGLGDERIWDLVAYVRQLPGGSR